MLPKTPTVRSLMRTLPLIVLSTLLSLSSAACASNRGGGESAPASPARVQIENRSSLDMDLYVRTGPQRPIRLGLAPASERTTFALAPGLLAGSGLVRFEARPVRGQGQPVLSEPFSVAPGEDLQWSIPPQ
jgi:hypothetical protein